VAAVGVAVVVSGAVLLGVEIAASRVLSPFFGNSLFVWGSLIGVVLAGLAAGYWLGGSLVDRYPRPQLLVAVMGLGAAAVLAVPLFDEPVLEWVVGWDPGPRANPLVAATILFLPASVIIAGVSPIAVRLRAESVGTVGRTAGHLFALSTAGSIAGTLGTAFWLLPTLGTGQLFAFGALALLAAAAVVSAVERIPIALAAALLAAVGAGAAAVELAPDRTGTLSAAASRNWSPIYRARNEAGAIGSIAESFDILYQKETRYHRLFVAQDEDTRYLRFDASIQSAMYRDQPYRTRLRYADFFHLGLAYNPDARDALFIGLGAGSSPKRLWRDFPELRIQAVELDPVVRDVAYRYFGLPRDDRLKVDVDDGRRWLDRHDQRWDVIMIDAFFADSIPFHLYTTEFLELARSRLKPGGVVVTNTIGAMAGVGSEMLRSLYRTYRSQFPTVLVHPVSLPGEEDATDFRNVIFVATEQPAPRKDFLLSRWREIAERFATVPDLRRPIRDRWESPLRLDGVPILTDDYAPTDSLLLLAQ
ncbi:MAG: fused MFS/spermidine synthase, partial [Actinomycetota bacterium]|nr:fused MFS/spermidine synthase [Actinomycetota bacterium]